MDSKSSISIQTNNSSNTTTTIEPQQQKQPANIVQRSNNRSIASSLRRLVTITFSRNTTTKKNRNSSRKAKIDNTLEDDDNSNNPNDSVRENVNGTIADQGIKVSANPSKKQTRDKVTLYKQKNSTPSNSSNANNFKKRKHTINTVSSTSSVGNSSANNNSSNNNYATKTNLFSRSSLTQSNGYSLNKIISRRASQPPHLEGGISPTKTSSAVNGDTISLNRRLNQHIMRQQLSSNSCEKPSASSWMMTDDEDDNENVDVDLNDNKSKISDKSHNQDRISNKSNNNSSSNKDGKNNCIECPLCVFPISETPPYLASCKHKVCLECLQLYITTEINHSRLNITCPICSEPIHPNTIKNILKNEKYYLKYESFMLRRVLAAEPDARWCPAPDCGYVVLANGCASCPKLVCGREGCNTSFCYHCKQEWHPNQTCNAASILRNKKQLASINNDLLLNDEVIQVASTNQSDSSNKKGRKSSKSSHSIKADDIKECPVCASRIIKMNDGSCNHMTCSICETEFCWLCMKEISDLHYFSPSGCTFWGKKPWSRKKKLLWQLGMLVGAPICIILIAGIAVPAIVIGIPVWAARKLHNRLERKPFSRYRKNAIITGGVLLSFVVSPIISAVALAIGIPILLGYVYGVVPLSLCRSSGGCLSGAPSLENLQNNLQQRVQASFANNQNGSGNKDGISIDSHSISRKLGNTVGDPSIGETSLYMSNISLGLDNHDSASNAALAGSIMSSNNGGDESSIRGGYTLVPAEIHQIDTATSAKNS